MVRFDDRRVDIDVLHHRIESLHPEVQREPCDSVRTVLTCEISEPGVRLVEIEVEDTSC